MNKEDKKKQSTETNEEMVTGTEQDIDVNFEEVNEEGEVDAHNTIKKLREKIKKLEGEKQEYLDLSQRTRADYVNFKKEVEQARTNDRKFATMRFIEKLLPLLDAYGMARNNKEAWEKVDQNWRMGIEYIFNQFNTILESEQVTQFGKVGDNFDPKIHESMEVVPVTNKEEDGKIVSILQLGYKMHDMILRPARVKIGKLE